MEPQIIDYYNEMPSGTNVINKLNEEFNELQIENQELNQKLKKLTRPKVLYNSAQEWIQACYCMSENILRELNELIVNDEFEFSHMKGFNGITPRQRINLNTIIEMEMGKLYKIKNYKDSDRSLFYAPSEIVRNIEIVMKSIIDAGFWKNDSNKICKLISNYIFNVFDLNYIDDTGDDIHIPIPNIFDGIAMFKCHKCHNIVDFDVDAQDNICIECYDLSMEQ